MLLLEKFGQISRNTRELRLLSKFGKLVAGTVKNCRCKSMAKRFGKRISLGLTQMHPKHVALKNTLRLLLAILSLTWIYHFHLAYRQKRIQVLWLILMKFRLVGIQKSFLMDRAWKRLRDFMDLVQLRR